MADLAAAQIGMAINSVTTAPTTPTSPTPSSNVTARAPPKSSAAQTFPPTRLLVPQQRAPRPRSSKRRPWRNGKYEQGRQLEGGLGAANRRGERSKAVHSIPRAVTANDYNSIRKQPTIPIAPPGGDISELTPTSGRRQEISGGVSKDTTGLRLKFLLSELNSDEDHCDTETGGGDVRTLEKQEVLEEDMRLQGQDTSMLKAPRAVYRGTLKSGARAARKLKALKRFRRVVRLVMVARYWFRCGRPPKLSQPENILFFLDIPTVKQDDGRGGGIVRRPSFKTKGVFTNVVEHTVEGLARKILMTPPAYRTDDHLHQLMQTLQTFSKFSGYPINVQRRLCKLGWYAKFEPSRIMVRHQQRAEIYYFLLSGIAISRAVDDEVDPGESRRRQRAIFLRRGDTIGEKELLQNINREVTVVTKETVEVLGMDKEDFLETFKMVMGDKLDFLPFLKTVGELLFFPLELLQAHYCASAVQNYRKGAVITRNSNEADWVYVIKKGSCQVFQSLRSRPRENSTRSGTETLAVPTGMFPAISAAKSSSELTVRKSQYGRRKRDKYSGSGPPRRSISDSHLPRIVLGPNLVTKGQQADNDLPTTPLSDDEAGDVGRRRRHAKSGSFPSPGLVQDDTGSPANYTCLETLTTGSTFGLQTLIYKDTPILFLVSQGSECIMVSKQFLRDHLDSTTLNKLRNKVAPYTTTGLVQETGDSQRPRVMKKSASDPADNRNPWDNNYTRKSIKH